MVSFHGYCTCIYQWEAEIKATILELNLNLVNMTY